MKIAGKVRPDKEQLNEFYEKGFDHFELFLTTAILNERTVSDIVEDCKDSKANIASVHTPHINENEENVVRYFEKTDEIASRLDAALVFDSNPLGTRYAASVYPSRKVSADEHGYENDPSVSSYYLRVNHLQQGLPLVLDTAHIHMSENEYMGFIEEVLIEYSEQVPVIHLADGTRRNDGVSYGEGTVDIEKVLDLLQTYDYDGVVVLEVPVNKQVEDLRKVNEIID